jgi:tetratricopeptide (TPR) repeat protein
MHEQYTSKNIISEITKIYKLKEKDIYSDEEYSKRIIDIITDVIKKGISQYPEDLQSGVLSQIEKNILNIDEINLIIKKEPINLKVDLLICKIFIYFLKDYDIAIELVSEVISKCEDLKYKSLFLTLRGYSYYKNDEFDKALEDFEIAEINDSDNASLYYYRSWIYWKQKNYEKALEECHKAFSLSPNEEDFIVKIAEIYRETNRHEKALEYIQKAIDLNPEAENNYFFKIDCLVKLNKKSEALKVCNSMPGNIISNNLNYKLCLTELYIENEFYNEAINILENLKLENPNEIRINRDLAKCNYAIEKFNEAIDNISECIENKEKCSDNDYYQRAICNFYLNRHNESLEDLFYLIEKYQESALYYEIIASNYESLGDFVNAKKYYIHSAELGSTYAKEKLVKTNLIN